MHPQEHPSPDRSLEALAARLRALSPPPVPAGLEDRLLAGIPAQQPIARRRWIVRAGLAGAVAAACVLALVAWPRHDDRGPVRPGPIAQPLGSQLPADTDPTSGWRLAHQMLDESATPTFAWPLPQTPPLRGSASIPPDLLD